MEAQLFVYGTLMIGVESRMAGLLQRNSKWLGSAYISGELFDLGRYPGAQWIPEYPGKVYGQVFTLEDPAFLMPYLDEYEGIDPLFPEAGEYVRKLVPTFLEDTGQSIDTWLYHYNFPADQLVRIESGRYLDYYRQQPAHLEFIRTG